MLSAIPSKSKASFNPRCIPHELPRSMPLEWQSSHQMQMRSGAVFELLHELIVGFCSVTFILKVQRLVEVLFNNRDCFRRRQVAISRYQRPHFAGRFSDFHSPCARACHRITRRLLKRLPPIYLGVLRHHRQSDRAASRAGIKTTHHPGSSITIGTFCSRATLGRYERTRAGTPSSPPIWPPYRIGVVVIIAIAAGLEWMQSDRTGSSSTTAAAPPTSPRSKSAASRPL